jgi:hypothetical protein
MSRRFDESVRSAHIVRRRLAICTVVTGGWQCVSECVDWLLRAAAGDDECDAHSDRRAWRATALD